MYLIAAIGLSTIGFSLLMAWDPAAWSRGIVRFSEKSYFHIAEIATRLVLGAILVFFAANTAFPIFFWILGGIFIFAGTFLIVVRSKKHREIALQTATFTKLFRPAGIAGIILGAFIIYAALSKP